MTENLEKILKNLPQAEPAPGLSFLIFAKIERHQILVAKLKLYFFSFSFCLSLVGAIEATKYVLLELGNSGFYQYLSLIVSEGGNAFVYWKELTLALVESVPVVEFMIFFVGLFLVLGSFGLALKNVKIALLKVKTI